MKRDPGIEIPVTPHLAEVLREVLPCGGEDLPTSVRGWLATGRKWRRIRADYPNGWVMTVFFDRQGDISSSSCKLRMVSARAAA